jgi:hypothetical protein
MKMDRRVKKIGREREREEKRGEERYVFFQ